MDDEPYCLVLSGGGAKGVFHIGAWRALKELGIPVNAFVGNSIGAIMAAFLAEGKDAALEEIGRTITVDNIVKLPEGFKENGVIKLVPAKFPRLGELYRGLADKKGLDTSPMRKALETLLDETGIRNSGKDLGLVTVNVSDMRPRELFIEEMEQGKLIDYLMASSAFPGFERPEIAGKKYIDGGFWDNIPYGMARKRGYRKLIVIDISGAGINRHPDIAGSETVYIKNSMDMGGPLDFNRQFLDNFNLLGYLDTMRVFGRYRGYSYFIEPDDALETRFKAFLASDPKISAKNKPARFPEQMRYDRNLLLKYLECAALILGVERIKVYTYETLAAAVRKRQATEDGRLLATPGSVTTHEKTHGLETLIRASLRSKTFEECPYHLVRTLNATVSGRTRSILKRMLYTFWPSLDAGFRYIQMAERFWGVK